MRKLTVSVAAIAAVAAGAGVTAMIVGPAPSAAAPSVSAFSCPMKGSGPTLICGYQVAGQTLTVALRNTANGPIPVNCNLLGPLTPNRPVASAIVGSGEQRQLITTGGLGVQTYTIDCRSVVGGEIAQSAVISPNFGSGVTPVPTTPVPTTPWRPPLPRLTSSHMPRPPIPQPSLSRQPMPRPQVPRPTMPTVTTTPTVTPNLPNRPTLPSPRPQLPTLTTTTPAA